MKAQHFACLAGITALIVGEPLRAKDKGKGAEGPPGQGGAAELTVNSRPAPGAAVSTEAQARRGSKEPWVGVSVTISDGERRVIQDYVHDCQPVKKSGRKAKGLPPGLAKKVARGGQLPPGWQKKCRRGEVLPEEVYSHCHPLPPEVVVKLPAPPPGTILVAIDGKVVRLAKATREILDVFDVKF